MKKKANPRQTREQNKAAQRAKYQEEANQKREAERQEAEQAERERQRQQAEKDREKVKALWDSPSAERKSTAKAAGLKSTFILGEDHLLMTAFGKGNQALPEKDIVSGQVTDMRAEAAFQAIPDRERFLLNGRVPGASTDDPLHRAPKSQKNGDDLIHCRSALEQRYFGETFEDNIHIQLIYNILDIEKLLSGHINNEIDALVNALRSCADETAKIDIYSAEPRRVWPQVSSFVLDHILPDTAAIRDLVPDQAINPQMLDGVLIDDDAHGFSKLIYMMTLFMDAKEINDLLTTLINKFENIGSFMDVLKLQGLRSEIDPKYRIFADAWDVAGELRVINSFARMRKPTLKARRPQLPQQGGASERRARRREVHSRCSELTVLPERFAADPQAVIYDLMPWNQEMQPVFMPEISDADR